MDLVAKRRQELEQLTERLGNEVRHIAREEFKLAIAKTGQQLTGELKNSFDRAVVQMARDVTSEVIFSFGQYGRFRDLKYVEYEGRWKRPQNVGKNYRKDADGVPLTSELPEIVQGMVAFVEERGVEKFKFIPGYKKVGKRMPTTNRAIQRLAWTMAANRMSNWRKKNKETQWYARTVSKILNEVRPIAAKGVAELLTNGHYTQTWRAE